MNLTRNGKTTHTNGHFASNGEGEHALAMRHPTHRIEVFSKSGFSDSAGTALLSQLPLIGISSAQEIRVGVIYELIGRYSLSQATAAAGHLFADPVTQEFMINNGKMLASQLGPHWRVEVGLKPSVLDPIAESIRRGMGDLGLPAPEAVRTITVYQFIGRLNQNQIEKIVAKLLVNPVIHRFCIEAH